MRKQEQLCGVWRKYAEAVVIGPLGCLIERSNLGSHGRLCRNSVPSPISLERSCRGGEIQAGRGILVREGSLIYPYRQGILQSCVAHLIRTAREPAGRGEGAWGEHGALWWSGAHGQALSLRHTCRTRGRPTFSMLVEAVSWMLAWTKPDLRGITWHESLPVLSTP